MVCVPCVQVNELNIIHLDVIKCMYTIALFHHMTLHDIITSVLCFQYYLGKMQHCNSQYSVMILWLNEGGGVEEITCQ